MPRIDFYVIDTSDIDSRLRFTCRLTELAYRRRHWIYLHADSEAQATRLDDLLWTFRQGSFIPHILGSGPMEGMMPVHIGWHPRIPQTDHREGIAQMLINLSPEVPAFFNAFERVAEVVDQEPAVLVASRKRFATYRQYGATPETHKITSADATFTGEPSS